MIGLAHEERDVVVQLGEEQIRVAAQERGFGQQLLALGASEIPASAIQRVLVVMVTSKAEGNADVDDPGTRVRAGVDTAEARITADAVDLGIEARVAREDKEVLPSHVQPRSTRARD